MFTWSNSCSRADLKENESLLLCCFYGTTFNIILSLAQCDTSPPQRDPQCTESAGHLQTWCDMEPADHPAGEQSQSPWKKGRNISWLLNWVQSLQNTETAEDSPYQQSPNGGHLHSDLHRRTRHEGLLPTNKRILQAIKDFFTKNLKKYLPHGNILYVSTVSLHVNVKSEDTQNDFQAVLFSCLHDSQNKIA